MDLELYCGQFVVRQFILTRDPCGFCVSVSAKTTQLSECAQSIREAKKNQYDRSPNTQTNHPIPSHPPSPIQDRDCNCSRQHICGSIPFLISRRRPPSFFHPRRRAALVCSGSNISSREPTPTRLHARVRYLPLSTRSSPPVETLATTFPVTRNDYRPTQHKFRRISTEKRVHPCN